jgi:hypothetical protein
MVISNAFILLGDFHATFFKKVVKSDSKNCEFLVMFYQQN